jgi:fructokinase
VIELDNSSVLTVVGLGEALFDRFSPERVVLGGAPVNLAVHAHQLLQARGQGIVASNVGDDDLGNCLQAELTKRGMTTECVTVSEDFPTGTVEVSVDEDGSPSYEIRENVAWDHLQFAESWQRLAPTCSAVCFGTLAQRSSESRSAIQQFLVNSTQALHVLDLNLRQFYYTADIIHESLQAVEVLKLNNEELAVVSKALEIGDPVVEIESQTAGAERPITVDTLIKRYDLKLVALTRGELGTVLYAPGEQFEADVPRFPREPNADSVGAGDACCAAIIVGLLLGKPLAEVVDLANRAGAFVASQAGATPVLPAEILELVER